MTVALGKRSELLSILYSDNLGAIHDWGTTKKSKTADRNISFEQLRTTLDCSLRPATPAATKPNANTNLIQVSALKKKSTPITKIAPTPAPTKSKL